MPKYRYFTKSFVLVPFFCSLLLFATNTPAAFLTTDCTDTVATGVPQIECEALEAFWDSTNGLTWTGVSNWDSNLPINNWTGIQVLNGNVTILLMNDNNLTGNLPPELGNLSELTELIIGGHSLLGGGIPATFGNLTKLKILTLFENQLTGAIPAELGDLSALEELVLAKNQLTGSIPANLGNLGNLTYLNLFDNQLDGAIPATLGNLTQLYDIQLQDNKLSGTIPKELGTLSNLRFLTLSFNQLSGSIPVELTNLNVWQINLSSNLLRNRVPDFTGMSNLLRFGIDDNNFVFSDFEPEHLTYLANLGGSYTYNIQGAVDSNRTINVNIGQTLSIIPELAENPSGNDTYQWRKIAQIPGPAGTQRIYTKQAVLADAGEYRYRVRNSVIVGVDLVSHNFPDVITVVIGPSQANYTVGGSVSGLTGNLTLQNNGADNLDINTNGGFTFSTELADGVAYNVTVLQNPAGQTCTLTNAGGVIAAANISNIQVSCVDDVTPPAYTVGGTVSGLSGSVSLQNNGADDLIRNVNGSFTFPATLSDGDVYGVTVLQNPAGQTCTAANASGTIAAANVTDIQVDCVDDVLPPVAPAVAIPSLSFLGISLLGLLMGLGGLLIGFKRAMP